MEAECARRPQDRRPDRDNIARPEVREDQPARHLHQDILLHRVDQQQHGGRWPHQHRVMSLTPPSSVALLLYGTPNDGHLKIMTQSETVIMILQGKNGP